jgi:hypothetical protein
MGLPRHGPFESAPYPSPPWGMSIPSLEEAMACPRDSAMGERRFSMAQKDPAPEEKAPSLPPSMKNSVPLMRRCMLASVS